MCTEAGRKKNVQGGRGVHDKVGCTTRWFFTVVHSTQPVPIRERALNIQSAHYDNIPNSFLVITLQKIVLLFWLLFCWVAVVVQFTHANGLVLIFFYFYNAT
jgi:hypothetical protein